MSTTDYLVLVGIAVTVIGWFVTFLRQMAQAQAQARFNGEVQKQLEGMKEQFALSREHRQYVLPDQLAELKEISDWIRRGYTIAGDLRDSVSDPDNIAAGIPEKDREPILAEYSKWQAQHQHIYALSIRYNDVTFNDEDRKILNIDNTGQLILPEHVSEMHYALHRLQDHVADEDADVENSYFSRAWSSAYHLYIASPALFDKIRGRLFKAASAK